MGQRQSPHQDALCIVFYFTGVCDGDVWVLQRDRSIYSTNSYLMLIRSQLQTDFLDDDLLCGLFYFIFFSKWLRRRKKILNGHVLLDVCFSFWEIHLVLFNSFFLILDLIMIFHFVHLNKIFMLSFLGYVLFPLGFMMLPFVCVCVCVIAKWHTGLGLIILWLCVSESLCFYVSTNAFCLL